MAGGRVSAMFMGLDPSGKIVNGSDMSTLRGSKNYVWDERQLLGQGATSFVYKGREKRTGDEVAVKVFTPQSFHRPCHVQAREFQVMKRLDHINIVRLLAIEEEQTRNGGEVIVMELCPCGSLYNVLESPENGYGLCEEELLLVLKQVSAGVKHLRDNDIVHRDIKPGNILRCVGDDGRSIYKLTDFGAARELQDNEEFMSLYGTEEYLHPDMYEKAVLRRVQGQQFGVHVDLWSLGVTFYHASTGYLPFRPYGGRRNKETMHMITTQKEQGVISGVQMTENGPIEYRKELPNTCRLSQGLKRLLTPFLAALLEKDQSRTLSFEQFFEQVESICSKVEVNIFCPSLLQSINVYADRKDTLDRLKELIYEQTGISSANQMLLVGGQKLDILVPSSRRVGEYRLDISPTNPIFVFSIAGAFPQRPYMPSVGQFPQLNHVNQLKQPITLDYDYQQCKKCCGVLQSIMEAVRITTDTTTLLNMAVHMYCSCLKQQVDVLQASLKCVSNQMTVVSHWLDSIKMQLKHHLDFLRLTQVVSGPSADKVAKWVKVIQAAQQTHKNDCEVLLQKLQASIAQATSQMNEAVRMHVEISDWQTSRGCTTSDRCSSKVRVMLDRMMKILAMFKENRSKKDLNYNDQQIHKFEKNNLGELCTQARSMLTDNCLQKRKGLHVAYREWSEKATQCQDLITRLGASVNQINDAHTQLTGRFKYAETKCGKLVDDCVEHLRKEAPVQQPSAGHHPPVASSNGSNGTPVLGSGDLAQGPGSGGSQFVGGLNSRQERLDSLLDLTYSSRKDLEEVEMLVNENTQLIRNFSSLMEEEKTGMTS